MAFPSSSKLEKVLLTLPVPSFTYLPLLSLRYIPNTDTHLFSLLLALHESKTEICVQFKPTSLALLPSAIPNTLTIRVQPDEGVYLQINSNLPSLRPGPRTTPMTLDLTYRGHVPEGQIPDAYESLILDAVKGDYTHSVRGDELDASWRVFTPLLHLLDQGGGQLEEYAYGEYSRILEPSSASCLPLTNTFWQGQPVQLQWTNGLKSIICDCNSYYYMS